MNRFFGIKTIRILCIIVLFLICPFDAATSANENPKPDYDVIVIGGGLGGLSAAAHLAVNHLHVLVLEQHDKVGGCATRFERGEFTFDASLHEMAGGGPGKKDRGLFQLLKITGVDKKIEFIELPEFYRSIFPGVDITLPSNWEGFKNVLKSRWPQESKGIDQFHIACTRTFDDLMELKDLFRYAPVKAFLVKSLIPLRQPAFFRYKNKTFQDVLDECFQDEDLKAVVSQLWVYYGAPVPFQSTLIGLAATESYLTDGVWHIKGTSQALSNAYAERIQELGSEVKTNSLVTKVIMENRKAVGVQIADGTTYSCRYIVANTDPFQLTYNLVGREFYPESYLEKLDSLQPANSLFGVYLGLNIDLAQLGYTNTEIFYNPTRDTVALHDNMMNGNFKNGAVAITIYTNFGDPVYAPKGKSVVTLTAYSDYNYWPEDKTEYYALKDQKVEELIHLAANVIPELANPENIEVKEGFTPRTLKRFTLNKDGVVYGFYLSPEQWQKIPNDTPIPNIYIASNWSQAWHGMGSAQINGWRAARLILDKEGIK